MSISATAGTAANNSGSVSSLALSAFTTTSGRDIVFVIVLGSTSSSVSSITNSAGTYGTFTSRVTINGTGVRVEIWTVHVTTGASTVFTVNITGGATSVSFEAEEYSGVSSIGNTGTNSGSSLFANVFTAIQEGGNFIVGGFGFACQSGDTLSAKAGTSRQSSIPAATAVGGALYDQTQTGNGTLQLQTALSSSRQWAAAGIELRGTSLVSTTFLDYAASAASALAANRDARFLKVNIPIPFAGAPGSTLAPTWGTWIFCNGTIGIAYAHYWDLELGGSPTTFSVVSGSLPPGLTLASISGNQGRVSGTPTTAGTYSFTLRATNAYGTADHAFSITIGTAGGGGAFAFLA